MDTIIRRHDSVSTFARNDNFLAIQSMSKSLSKIKDMRSIVAMLHRGIEGGMVKSAVKSSVWSPLLDFCCHIIELAETLQEISGISLLSISRHLRDAFNRAEFQELGKRMFDIVDLEESASQKRTVVKRGVDSELDDVKDAFQDMERVLQTRAIETSRELESAASPPTAGLSVLYIPRFGYLVQLPSEVAKDLMQERAPFGWQRSFVTETHAYFKTTRMREMDDELGDLWSVICDREIEISYHLAQKVLEKEQLLLRASELCGELDCLLALAHGANEYKLHRPRMVEDNVIDIRGGRHLLQELVVPSYIANDSLLLGGHDNSDKSESDNVDSSLAGSSMLLVTGPNYSGKSVYLKQIALIVYMAQVGSFVPADHARLGLTDKILTRVTERETVSRGQSSFMIDLQQMAWALNTFSPRSLLVIDEFGKGTDSCDGAGLMAGFIKYLSSLGSISPKTVACTHFHEIFEHGFVSENEPGLDLLQMEVHIIGKNLVSDNSQSTDSDEVVYLYKVQPGRSTLAYGTQCAAMNGIPETIVTHANQLTEAMLRGDDLVSVCSWVTAEEYKELEDAEAISRSFLELDLSSLDASTVSVKSYLEDFLGNTTSESSH